VLEVRCQRAIACRHRPVVVEDHVARVAGHHQRFDGQGEPLDQPRALARLPEVGTLGGWCIAEPMP
jgi:hypothetical protein